MKTVLISLVMLFSVSACSWFPAKAAQDLIAGEAQTLENVISDISPPAATVAVPVVAPAVKQPTKSK